MATAAATAEPKLVALENWRPKANPWVVAAVVAMAAFMEVLDTSIANVALPHIAGSLSASLDESTWVLTAYLVSNAVVLPMGGWVASVIGRKRFFMSCIVIFTISSFLCGIAASLPLLLLFRVLQGAGGGGLQPMAQAIMADSFEPAKRGLAFALYGIVAVLAPSIGPTLGGWITDNYSWNWIFYINIPVGILTLVLTNRLVEDPPWNVPDKKNFFKLDYVGVSLLVISMGALQIALDKGEENDWFGSHFIVTCAVTFAESFIALIALEWFSKAPLMDLKLFKNRNFAVCCFLMLLTGGFLNSTTVLLPQYLQSALGYTATWAGLALSGGSLVLLVIVPITGQMLTHFPARNIIAFGFFCFTISYFVTANRLNLGLSFGESSWLRILQVGAIPVVFIAVTTAAYFGMPREKNNQVAGLINFARNIGGSILISLTNAAVVERAQFHQDQLLKYITPANENFQQQVQSLTGYFDGRSGPQNAGGFAQGEIYRQLIQQSQTLAYVDVFYVLCGAAMLMVPLSFLLKKNHPHPG